ncbi:TPA: hypothetical protein ACGOR9_002226 [Streptococcus suis]
MTGKTMTPEELKKFLTRAHRSQYEDNPGAYKKAIQATLYALGYDHDWCYSTGDHLYGGLLAGFKTHMSYEGRYNLDELDELDE